MAGPVKSGQCITPNLPWVIDSKELARIEARLVSGFIATNNNRSRVAQYLNISSKNN